MCQVAPCWAKNQKKNVVFKETECRHLIIHIIQFIQFCKDKNSLYRTELEKKI